MAHCCTGAPASGAEWSDYINGHLLFMEAFGEQDEITFYNTLVFCTFFKSITECYFQQSVCFAHFACCLLHFVHLTPATVEPCGVIPSQSFRPLWPEGAPHRVACWHASPAWIAGRKGGIAAAAWVGREMILKNSKAHLRGKVRTSFEYSWHMFKKKEKKGYVERQVQWPRRILKIRIKN